jgi:hypothetical protein
MLALELLTGCLPFNEKPSDFAVITAIQSKDERPLQPGWNAVLRGLTNDVWTMLYACWEKDPASRPKLHEMVAFLQDKATKWVPPPKATVKNDRRRWTVSDCTMVRVLNSLAHNFLDGLCTWLTVQLVFNIILGEYTVKRQGPPANRYYIQSIRSGLREGSECSDQAPRRPATGQPTGTIHRNLPYMYLQIYGPPENIEEARSRLESLAHGKVSWHKL